jgi:hypothetical protein
VRFDEAMQNGQFPLFELLRDIHLSLVLKANARGSAAAPYVHRENTAEAAGGSRSSAGRSLKYPSDPE